MNKKMRELIRDNPKEIEELRKKSGANKLVEQMEGALTRDAELLRDPRLDIQAAYCATQLCMASKWICPHFKECKRYTPLS